MNALGTKAELVRMLNTAMAADRKAQRYAKKIESTLTTEEIEHLESLDLLSDDSFSRYRKAYTKSIEVTA